MTGPVSRAPVLVLDVREPGEGRTALESADLETGSLLLPEHVVVVARVKDLPGLTAGLAKLAKVQQLSGVILVAVGPLRTAKDQFELRVPAVLAGLGVTLWAGSEAAIEWSGSGPRGLVSLPDVTIDDLLAALTLPLVFERVHKAVSEVPHQAVSPGLEIKYATVPDNTLRLLRLRALRHFTADGGENHRTDGPVAAAVARLSTARTGERAVITVNSPLDQARTTTVNAVNKARAAVARATRGRGLFTGDKGTESAVRMAGDALESYRDTCMDTANRMTESIRNGVPRESELVAHGLPPQLARDTPELADELTEAVKAELALKRPLRTIAENITQVANGLNAIGDPALAAPGAASVQPVLTSLRARPEIRLRPALFGPLLAFAVLSCFAASVTGPAGPVTGLLVAGVWVFLLIRLLSATELRIVRARLLLGTGIGGVALAALAGIGLGVTKNSLPTALVSLPVSVAVSSALCLLAVWVVMALWRNLHTRWGPRSALDHALPAVRALTRQLTDQVDQCWLPGAGRTRLADSLINVAVALEGLHSAFSDAAAAFAGAQPVPLMSSTADSANDLNRVLRDDLTHLVFEALRPVFVEIAANGPLSANGRPFFDAGLTGLARYNAHLDNHGIRTPPPGFPDDDTRRTLATGLWRESADARRILLSGPRSPLPQLCTPNDLRQLNPADMAMVYFASLDLLDPPVNPAYDLIRTSGNAVGVLRLVPLRAGVVSPLIDDGEVQ
ncbi:hypothetical protein [Actinocrispum wychmicini]|uniref:Uncharacterized protein n=1 Tax=Actinocrispum wychmicini TaxID=1213861 RepID=A0A4R2J8S6_9PSEU|nr:hypothetical protein [Actinocrispum wychmicini]TCO52948.1 hypothetical protein EV192_111142 [Actinocrispum wychmicini]